MDLLDQFHGVIISHGFCLPFERHNVRFYQLYEGKRIAIEIRLTSRKEECVAHLDESNGKLGSFVDPIKLNEVLQEILVKKVIDS